MVAVSNAETENLNKLSGSFVDLCQEFANWMLPYLMHFYFTLHKKKEKKKWFILRVSWENIVSEKKKSLLKVWESFYLHFPFSFDRRTFDLEHSDKNSLFFFFFPLSEHKCPVDEREQLEETLPLILGLILGLVIVVTLVIYHIHHKMTANQVQIPRDRSQYKHMG